MYRILKGRADGWKDAMTDFAKRLVATPSVSLSETAAAAMVEEEMKRLGYDEVIRDEAGNVAGVLFGREGGSTLLLAGHLDTVIADDRTKWTRDPHDARVENGRLEGLGASDCKGGIAAQVYAGAMLKRSLLPLAGNLVVAATVAEENGRSVGVRELVTRTLLDRELKPTCAVLGEPTGLGLYYGHDGWFELEIVVKGANPFHVDDAANAIHGDLLAARRARAGGAVETHQVHRPVFETDRNMRSATIRMERRLSPSEEVGEILRHIERDAALVTETSGEVAVKVLVRQEPQRLYTGQTTMVRHVTNAWAIDPFDPLLTRARQALAAAGCEARPGKWQLGRLGMGTAGGTLVTEFNIPTVGYGPGEETLAHAANESVAVDAILTAAYGTASIAHSLVGVPVCGWTSDEI